MTDKLDPAEVLRRLNGCIGSGKPGHITHAAASLIRQMQADMAEADRLLAFVVPAASFYSDVAEARRSLAPYLPKPDPLVEAAKVANEAYLAGNGELADYLRAELADYLRAELARRGGTITWKDGV